MNLGRSAGSAPATTVLITGCDTGTMSEDPHPSRDAGGRAAGQSLPAADPAGPGLRRGDRIAPGSGPQPLPPPGQSGAAEAGGSAARVQLQAAGRLQQDGRPHPGGAGAGRDRRQRRQPRPGGGPGRPAPGLHRRDRDAGHHTGDEGARRCWPAAPRWCCTATPTTKPAPRPGGWSRAGAQLHPPLRRSRCDRRPGHDRPGDPAPVLHPARRHLRGGGGRRADRRDRRLREEPLAPGGSDRGGTASMPMP